MEWHHWYWLEVPRGSVGVLVEDASLKAAGKNHKRPENPHWQKCEEEHSSGEEKGLSSVKNLRRVL